MTTHTRSSTATFTVGFYEDAEHTIPRVPIDDQQPTYEIVNPSGSVTATGVVETTAVAGRYSVTWPVPSTAQLSRAEAVWSINYHFVDANNNTATYSETFEVTARDLERDQDRRHGIIILYGKGAPLLYRSANQPHQISLEVTAAANPHTLIQTVRQALGLVPEELVDGDSYVYRDEVSADELLEDTTYTALWEVYDTPTSLPKYSYHQIHVISRTWLPYMSALDLVLNKIRARPTEVQSWTEYEKWNAIKTGLQIVNGWHPNTVSWPQISTFPHALLGHYLILAAQLWAMNALHMLEGMLAFNFSGQSVNLEYDHTTWVDSAIQRANEFLTSNLTRDKSAVVRRAAGVGAVIVRPPTFRARNTFLAAHRMRQDFTADTLVSQLVSFGLI